MSTTCSFCGSIPHTDDCANKLFDIINLLAQEIPPPNFSTIDNLVFQGGGVKGAAYIGVLKQLPEKVIKKVKRVAGTSAGALLSLCLALNLPIVKVEELLSIKFDTLLDDNTILEVLPKADELFSSKTKWYFSAKDVVLKGIELLPKLIDIYDESSQKLLQDFIYSMARYLLVKFNHGWINHLPIDLAKKFVKTFFQSLLNVLGTKPKRKKRNATSLAGENFVRRSPAWDFDKELDNTIGNVVENIRSQKDTPQDSPDNENSKNESSSFIVEEDIESQPLSDPSLLQDKVLYFAITQLIYHIAFEKENEKVDKPIGIFSGENFKQNWILFAMKEAWRIHDIDPHLFGEDITFKKLADIKDNEGVPIFKPLYVVAFNTGLLRTEVFSYEHTPNVSVADAVLASMSIPIFFTPKAIRENGKSRLVYTKEDQHEIAYYLDGGVMDNLPLWIFDDLKYCVTENMLPHWNPYRKISIQNPYTLGFKLLDSKRIKIYTKPFFGDDKTKPKKVNNIPYMNSFSYYIGALAKLNLEHEEAQLIHRNDGPRVVYVDNMGVSALDFSISQKDKDALIQSGKDAVNNYIERSKKGFRDEGETYPPRNIIIN